MEVYHDGAIVQLPDTVDVETTPGGFLMRRDKATNKVIPRYVAMSVNPVDPEYEPVKPFEMKRVGSSKKPKLVDANNVPVHPDGRVAGQYFCGHVENLWKSLPIMDAEGKALAKSKRIYRAMQSVPEFKMLFDKDTGRPKPHLVEEVWAAVIRLIMTRPEYVVGFFKELMTAADKNPLEFYTKMMPLLRRPGPIVLSETQQQSFVQLNIVEAANQITPTEMIDVEPEGNA